MDGSLTYARGGAGIFAHQTGPYAGPTPVRNVLIQGDGMLGGPAFAGFGQAAGGELTPVLDPAAISAMVARDVAARGFIENPAKTSGALALASWPRWKVIAVGGGIVLLAGTILFLATRERRT